MRWAQRAAPSAQRPEAPARADDFQGAARRLLRRVRRQRAVFYGMLVLGTTSVTLNVAGPKVLAHATDLIVAGLVGRRLPEGTSRADAVGRLREQGDDGLADMLGTVDVVPGHGIDQGALTATLSLAVAVYALSGLCWIAQGRLTTRVIQRTVRALRQDVAEKLSRLPLSHFDRQPRGEILSRATNDIDNIAQTLQQTISQLTNSLLLVVCVLGTMFWISPPLALVALVTVPLTFAVTAVIARRAKPHFVRQWGRTGRLTAQVEEEYTAHDLVLLHGRQRASAEELARHNEELFQAGYRAQFLSGAIQPALTFMGNLGYVLVAVAGGIRVASGALSIGDAQAFVQYSRQFGGPLTNAASVANLAQSCAVSAERVFALLDAPEVRRVPAAARTTGADGPRPPAGRLVFEDVSFRYTPKEPLIENLSLTVEPGQQVAVVGPTGAGKTTLVNLLPRFYDVTEGRIVLDGVDIAELPREELRRMIGMVPQDAWLFAGAIADNIAYGKEGATRAEVAEAARAARADHFIRTLPDGYDTVLGDGGSGVSAGEQQLITIARAFLADPLLLVLDEATSSVDTHTEALVQQAMARLSQGRTSIVIAHRLATVRDADVIVVLDRGSVVEQGTHAQLLAAQGTYARLCAARLR
ncbi:ABC transporter ATP-binding protein [Streptomyces kanamyceticus]|uniref:Fatty acid ABC transporter ATP-binding/permease protein n=1 Tax=Streptomyces kanamyceticus TaxID=1967 RepID=A0A5J6GJZ7_STRKN|nr:ABC transporter ATP-binding protein [Streptomyces kanamyceticus]QEU96220.1 ABC transporter ATP-binding protein [Streptomyces kanamyceticus]